MNKLVSLEMQESILFEIPHTININNIIRIEEQIVSKKDVTLSENAFKFKHTFLKVM